MMDMKRKAEDDSFVVTFIVGGLTYVLKNDVISRYPVSFFANIIKPKWRHNDYEPIAIERDGLLFQYVYDYLRYGFLPRDKGGRLTIDAVTKTQLAKEADFYQLPDLAKECKEEVDVTGFENHVNAFRDVKGIISGSKGTRNWNWAIPNKVVDLPHKDEDEHFTSNQSASYVSFAKLLKISLLLFVSLVNLT